MLKIAICDNSEVAIRALDYAIRQALAEIGLQYRIDSFNSGLALVQERESYDVLFLDIDMPKLDGIETAVQIRKRDTRVQIIFVTNYSDYQNRAFVVHAFGYIQKPYLPDQIQVILQDVVRYLDHKIESTPPRFPFKTDQGLIGFEVGDIYYFESKGHKLRIRTLGGEYLTNSNLNYVSELMEPWGFQLSHKSYLVNLFHIRRIKGYDILLENDEVIPLSQKKTVNFKIRYNEYLQNTFHSVL